MKTQEVSHPCGKPGLNSWLLALAVMGPVPALASIWVVNQQMGVLSSSISASQKQKQKQKQKNKNKKTMGLVF